MSRNRSLLQLGIVCQVQLDLQAEVEVPGRRARIYGVGTYVLARRRGHVRVCTAYVNLRPPLAPTVEVCSRHAAWLSISSTTVEPRHVANGARKM
jgi:hypothetical protein